MAHIWTLSDAGDWTPVSLVADALALTPCGPSLLDVGDAPSHALSALLRRVVRLARSGMPKIVKLAGAGSVSHIASIAAIFIFWFWPAV